MRWIFYVIKNARDKRGLLYNEQALQTCSHYTPSPSGEGITARLLRPGCIISFPLERYNDWAPQPCLHYTTLRQQGGITNRRVSPVSII